MRNIDTTLLDKLNNQHQTKANDAQPKMSVAVARARNTVMDSSYWVAETIRTGANLGDVSLAPRRQKVTGPPNRIYEIHVVGGVVGTAIREYPDKFKDGWQNQFTLGAGSKVAIAFDGEWHRYRRLWRLVTHEKPWIFWVDGDSKLWTQHWNDDTTKLQLATDVIYCRAIRAWKNPSVNAADQGIVVGYIKSDGNVYYRGYCIQDDGVPIWENEYEVTQFLGTASSLNMFITNDYRIGFAISDSLNDVYWYITGRNWAGMASPAEYINTGIKDVTFEVFPIKYTDTIHDEYIDVGITDVFFNAAEPIYPMPISASNDDEFTIKLKFNHEIDYDLSTVGGAFVIKDSTNKSFVIYSTQAGVDNSEIIFNMDNFITASGDMTINYFRTSKELDCLNQGSRFAIEDFAFQFTPDLTPPELLHVENLAVDLPIIFTVSQVTYHNTTHKEYVDVSISDISFVVTHVGSNPL